MDIFGLASCASLVLLLFGSLVLAVWAYLLGLEGSQSKSINAYALIVVAATFVAPAGAVLGSAGLAFRKIRRRTHSVLPSIVGCAGHSAIIVAGACFYLWLLD